MSNIRNPYNNVGQYPPEPFGSVVDKPSLIETAGLNPYNFQDFGQEFSAYNEMMSKKYNKQRFQSIEQMNLIQIHQINISQVFSHYFTKVTHKITVY